MHTAPSSGSGWLVDYIFKSLPAERSTRPPRSVGHHTASTRRPRCARSGSIFVTNHDGRNEFRKPPRTDALVAATRSRADTRVYDIDRAYPPEQPVPSEAIVGSWEVDRLGNLTGRFARNDRYRPVERCTRPLKPYVHAAAKSNRDQWIVEIDERGESSFPTFLRISSAAGGTSTPMVA